MNRSGYGACDEDEADEWRRIVAHTISSPEGQALLRELADLFIEAAKGKAGHVVLLETHSELIPLRIMRRIRETFEQRKQERIGIAEEDVAIYYVEPFKGATVVTRLNLSERGQLLDPWPEGFFEEGYRERFSD